MTTFIRKLTVIMGVVLLFSQTAAAKVTVFAAASMTNALQQVAEEYKKVQPTEEIVFSFASSSVLARQISEGAPVDLLISADQKWMDFLAEKKAIVDSSRTVLVGNDLVMIAPQSSKITEVNLADKAWQEHLKDTFLAVGDPDHVPAGIYAKTAFTHLGQWADVEHQLARAENVRSALAFVERGEAPLGVVYATDAAASKKVKVVAAFPADSHTPIEYPVAIVKGRDNQNTQAFLQYLTSPTAGKIFAEQGFSVK